MGTQACQDHVVRKAKRENVKVGYYLVFGLYVTKLKIKLLYHPLWQPTAMLYTSHMSVLPLG